MSAATDPREVARQWIETAEADHRAATLLLTSGEACPLAIVCFHAQQCVEKYLKALLSHRGVDLTKTHDIGTLVESLPPGVAIPLSKEEQGRLSYYAVSSRYPVGDEPIGRQEALASVDIANRARTAIRTLLGDLS